MPEPNPVSMLFCETSIRDEDDHRPSLVRLFNGLMAPGFPVVVPKMAVFVLTRGMPPDAELRLVVSGPGGKELVRSDVGKTAQKLGAHHETIVRLEGMMFESAGAYRFTLLADEREIVARELPLTLAGDSAGEQ